MYSHHSISSGFTVSKILVCFLITASFKMSLELTALKKSADAITFLSLMCVMMSPGFRPPLETKRKEGNVLFNDTLNTFYLRLYVIRHMVKNHKIAREDIRCHHMGNTFRLAARVHLYVSFHRQDNTYHSLCTPVVEHWLERKIAQWVTMKDRSDDP